MSLHVKLICRVRESIFDESHEISLASLKHIHVSRLFDASPEEFFDLYHAPGVIESAHLRASLLTKALYYLKTHPWKKIIVSGLFGESQIKALQSKADELQIGIAIEREAISRALTFQERPNENLLGGKFALTNPDFASALKKTGVPSGANPAFFWERWFKALYAETILSGLKIQQESSFFDFLREAARYTARPVNWTAVAKEALVSQATSRRWSAHLERLGIIDLIDPVDKVGKRRLARRQKLFWRAPGLAMWLTRTDSSDKKQLKFFGLNAIYLSLKDAFSDAHFSYALDTNGKEIPFLMERDGKKIGFYCVADEVEKKIYERDKLSYAKIGLMDFSVCHKLYIDNTH